MRGSGYNLMRDDAELLAEHAHLQSSFSIHLYPEHWTLNNGPKFLYNKPVSVGPILSIHPFPSLTRRHAYSLFWMTFARSEYRRTSSNCSTLRRCPTMMVCLGRACLIATHPNYILPFQDVSLSNSSTIGH